MLVGLGLELPQPLAEALAAGKAVSAAKLGELTFLVTVEETGRRWEFTLAPDFTSLPLSDGTTVTHTASPLREVRPLDATKHQPQTAQADARSAASELQRKIAALLAPAPLAFDSIVRALAGVGRKEVTEALREITTSRGAMHDLNLAGFQLVDIEEIDIRQQAAAAARAANALIGTAAVTKFIPYLSKDVIFSLGDRLELPTETSEKSDDEGEERVEPASIAAPKKPQAPQLASMRQIRSIKWDEATVATDKPLVDSDTVSLLAEQESKRSKHFGNPLQPLPESPISDETTLGRAISNYNKIAAAFTSLEARLISFEAACSAARVWISENESQRNTAVVAEIEQWAEAQQPTAKAGLLLHKRLRTEASLLRREIGDYITFRDIFPPRPA